MRYGIIIIPLLVLFAFRTIEAHACGGGFGDQLTVTASQTIIVRHVDGEETYIFNPSFCGGAADFGLILPVPGTLTSEPALSDRDVYDALDALSAPEIVIEEVCMNLKSNGAGGDEDAGADWDGDTAGGVDVVNSGQVGIFDWVLLRADETAAFTDWLDTNAYPYDDEAVAQFDYYVSQSWYFVAFKVTASEEAPAEGTRICGDFGPIRLAFSTDTPVIPSRIAAVGDGAREYFYWRLQIISQAPLEASAAVDYQHLRYTGKITAGQLADHPAIAGLAEEGDQFTSIDVQFWGEDMEEDIVLTPSDGPSEYRDTITEYKTVICDGQKGCTVITPGACARYSFLPIAFVALLFWFRRRLNR